MKALTIRQPYAARVVAGVKTVENRTAPTSTRGRVLIHAGAQIHDRFKDDAVWLSTWERSAVIGTVQLVDSHRAGTPACKCDAADGAEFIIDSGPKQGQTPYHWVLQDAVRFVTPIPRVKGFLGFWEPDDRVQHLASLEWAEAKR